MQRHGETGRNGKRRGEGESETCRGKERQVETGRDGQRRQIGREGKKQRERDKD